MTQIILVGGTGCQDPALYDERVAGYGSCAQDLTREEPQPRGWRWGCAPSWCEVWLGVE